MKNKSFFNIILSDFCEICNTLYVSLIEKWLKISHFYRFVNQCDTKQAQNFKESRYLHS
jgi:hypothetical protein